MPGDAYHSGAWAYDVAFSWDVAPEVDWLLTRLGDGVESVLEPFCGSGRMFPAFLRRGVAIAGVDVSEEMLALAMARMEREGLPPPDTLLADAADFDLARTFGGAVCPINSFAQLLTDSAAQQHLACMARHLAPGARYLVQIDVKTPERLELGVTPPTGAWDMGDGTTTVRSRWQVEEFDPETQIEVHLCVIEVIDGPRKGEVIRSRDRCRLWRWSQWEALIAASPFVQTGAYDGNSRDRPRLDIGPELEGKPLVWHELTRRPT